MRRRLTGKRIVVTGAAGGIGAAAARAFAREGALVGLLDLAAPTLDALADDIGPAAIALPCDVTDEPEVERAFARWTERHGGLDVVYACAGVQLVGADAPIHELTLESWNRTLSINATGVFLTLRHAVGAMLATGGGSVIVCGSPTGINMSGAGYSAYSASKAAAMALVRVVAADYAPHGIRANAIVPGTTVTPLIESLVADPETNARLVAGTPIGRLGTPDDLVGIAVYLASDESAFATGAAFAVDGGLTSR